MDCRYRAVDVAEVMLGLSGKPLEPIRLHYMLYQAQGWSLALLGTPLYRDPIEAWSTGPVTPSVYRHHRGRAKVVSVYGDVSNVRSAATLEILENTVTTCRTLPLDDLAILAHLEKPWLDALGTRAEFDDPNYTPVIPPQSIRDWFFAKEPPFSLDADSSADLVVEVS